MYQDRQLTCRDCGATFIFTTGEQEFYATKGLVNAPRRCPDCRRAAKQTKSDGGRGNTSLRGTTSLRASTLMRASTS